MMMMTEDGRRDKGVGDGRGEIQTLQTDIIILILLSVLLLLLLLVACLKHDTQKAHCTLWALKAPIHYQALSYDRL